MRGMGAIKVDAGDRKDNRTAMRPFYKELFTEAKMQEDRDQISLRCQVNSPT